MTPFQALYGRDPPPVIRGDVPATPMEEVSVMLQERNDMLELLRDHLVQAQNRMKQKVDKHKREVNYKVGDMVFLKIQPYKLRKLAKRTNQKLSPRFYGPYEVLEKISEVAYRLKLPDDSRVHPVFHVSLLKPNVADYATVQPLPTCISEELELQMQPEEILAIRGENALECEVLVKWKDMPTCENSWELLSKMTETFPTLHLEDKVSFEGGGVDTNDPKEGQKGKFSKGKVFERKKWTHGPLVLTP